MIRIIKESICIVTLSALLGFIINAFHPSGFKMSPAVSIHNKEIPYLTVFDANEKFRQGDPYFIDARSSEEFLDSHIKGSVNIPAFSDDEFKQGVEKYLAGDNYNRELIVYCWNKECNAAENIADKIAALGHGAKIFIMEDGFEGWIKQGFPVDK